MIYRRGKQDVDEHVESVTWATEDCTVIFLSYF